MPRAEGSINRLYEVVRDSLVRAKGLQEARCLLASWYGRICKSVPAVLIQYLLEGLLTFLGAMVAVLAIFYGFAACLWIGQNWHPLGGVIMAFILTMFFVSELFSAHPMEILYRLGVLTFGLGCAAVAALVVLIGGACLIGRVSGTLGIVYLFVGVVQTFRWLRKLGVLPPLPPKQV